MKGLVLAHDDDQLTGDGLAQEGISSFFIKVTTDMTTQERRRG